MGLVFSYIVIAIIAGIAVVVSLAVSGRTAVMVVLVAEFTLLSGQAPSVRRLRDLEEEVLAVAAYVQEKTALTGRYPRDLTDYDFNSEWCRDHFEIDAPDDTAVPISDDFWVYFWLPDENRTMTRGYSPREGWRFVDD